MRNKIPELIDIYSITLRGHAPKSRLGQSLIVYYSMERLFKDFGVERTFFQRSDVPLEKSIFVGRTHVGYIGECGQGKATLLRAESVDWVELSPDESEALRVESSLVPTNTHEDDEFLRDVRDRWASTVREELHKVAVALGKKKGFSDGSE